jgi:quercetin dioxygenase-like cupin family protein
MSKEAMVVRQGQGEQLSVTGAQLRFLCNAERTDKAWSLMEVTLPEHSGPPPHHHPWDEAYYVVEGQVRFSIEGREELVKAGEFVYAPGGTVHAFQGASSSPARMIIFDAPAHAEAFFKDVDRNVKEFPRDVGKMLAIGAQHDIQFVGP